VPLNVTTTLRNQEGPDMETEPLTKEEKAWLRRLQKVLDACPSDRFQFNTIGDADITVFDGSRIDEINEYHDNNGGEFCNAIDELDASFGTLDFPGNVHNTAG
jgi:hypothetical protein